MDAGELTRVFHAATADIEPRPGFTAAVVRGGMRRRNRNRVWLAGGLTVASTLLGTSVYALRPVSQQELQFADPRWSQPTRGDLAGDHALLDSAISGWRAGARFEDLRGKPHVYWAGNTPAGRVAIVVQQAYLHPRDELAAGDAGRLVPVLGVLAGDSGSSVFHLLATKYQSVNDDPRTYASFLVRSTILIVDPGVPLFVSAAPVDTLDGRLTRAWSRIPVTDGMAIAPVPDGVAPDQVKVLARSTQPAPDDKDAHGLVSLAGNRGTHQAAELLWRGPSDQVTRQVGGSPSVGAPLATFRLALERGGANDLGATGVLDGQWSVTAGLPDGRTAIVSERWLDRYPTRLFVALYTGNGTFQRLIPEAFPTASDTLPVHIHLPDNQGWLVANFGATLKFRGTPTEPWQPAGSDAALLPETATTVQVTKNGITSEVTLLK